MKKILLYVTLMFFLLSFYVNAALIDPGTLIDHVTKVDSVSTVQRVNNTPTMTVGGTDYEPGDNGRTFLVLATSGVEVNNATCFTKIYYPNSTAFVPSTAMNFLEHGIYYYDFTAPSILGVYIVSDHCTYLTSTTQSNATTGARVLGAGAGALSNTNNIDGSYWTSSENLADNHLIADSFNFTGINVTAGSLVSIDVLFTGNRPQLGLDPASDPLKFWIFNFNTSRFELLSTPFSYQASDGSFVFSITTNISNYVNSIGGVALYINDTVDTLGLDAANTILSIDQLNVRLNYQAPNTTITEVSGGSELNIRSRGASNITALLNAILANLTIVDNNSAVRAGSLNTTINSISANLTIVRNSLSGNFSSIQAGIGNNTIVLSQINNTVNNIFNQTNAINNTVNNINTSVTAIINTLNAMNQTINIINTNQNGINNALLIINNTINAINNNQTGINNALFIMNNTINGINASVFVMNTTINGITASLFIINNTINNNYALSVVINGTQYAILNNLSRINDTQYAILGNLSMINSTQYAILGNISLLSNNISSIQNSLNNLTLNIYNMQQDIDDIQSTVDNIENIVDNLNFSINITPILIKEDQILANLSNVTTNIITINSQIFGIDNALGIISAQIGNLTNNNTCNCCNQSLDAIFGNLSLIQLEIQGISINISAQNLTNINQSITGLIIGINEANKPKGIPLFKLLLFLIPVLLFVVGQVKNVPLFIFFSGLSLIFIGLYVGIGLFGGWLIAVFCIMGILIAIHGIGRAA